jgi:hypothetical protein
MGTNPNDADEQEAYGAIAISLAVPVVFFAAVRHAPFNAWRGNFPGHGTSSHRPSIQREQGL